MIAVAGPGKAAAGTCPANRISTVDGCATRSAVASELTGIIKQNLNQVRLQAVIARVDIAGHRILRRGFGESQEGVPATPAMNFRIGSMTIPALTTLVYQLRQRGRLKLSDPVSRWLPNLFRASEVTVRNLMNNSSGYYDWIQNNPAFQDEVLADPFRIWSGKELLDTALARGSACDPGACFSYAHTNFLILARIVRRILPQKNLVTLLNRRVLRPSGISMNFSRLAPIPPPALSAFATDRGIFEESTGWSPSWGLGNGMLATTSIDNVSRIATGVLTGSTLSSWARKDLVKRYAPGLEPTPDRVYFAQGIIMVNGWRRQNPFFNGYMGNVAWFPSRRIAISLVGTKGQSTTAPDGTNVTDAILGDMAGYLTPANSPAL
ncbi:MAG: beta-lactamase family protein [Solirubrobacterales bacterium]|nr:beta-lactamase family protein [Solirubrobacterales bacterium]